MEIKIVEIKPPEGVNVIIGTSHFIKSVEDLYEALVNSVPNIKFGLAFCEASGDRLVRYDGNDEQLIEIAKQKMFEIGAGHTFIIFIKNAYPINVLDRIKAVPEIACIMAASANPLQVLIAETGQGRAIIGIVDGYKPLGIEDEEKIKERMDFLRRIGYKK